MNDTSDTQNKPTAGDVIKSNGWTKDQAFSPANVRKTAFEIGKTPRAALEDITRYFRNNPETAGDIGIQLAQPDGIFDEEQYLGKAVTECKPFCTVSAKRPIQNIRQATTDICGAKASKLCGFSFISAVNPKSPYFMIVFQPKTANKVIYGKQSQSGWHCWRIRRDYGVNVVPPDTMFNEYKFDVAAFMTCDKMINALPKFAQQTKRALETVFPQFIAKMDDLGYNLNQIQEVQNTIKCVKRSLGYITQTDIPDFSTEYRLT